MENTMTEIQQLSKNIETINAKVDNMKLLLDKMIDKNRQLNPITRCVFGNYSRECGNPVDTGNLCEYHKQYEIERAKRGKRFRY